MHLTDDAADAVRYIVERGAELAANERNGTQQA
jgi:hypothetical protein